MGVYAIIKNIEIILGISIHFKVVHSFVGWAAFVVGVPRWFTY